MLGCRHARPSDDASLVAGMSSYYDRKLAASSLERCYELAPPRVQHICAPKSSSSSAGCAPPTSSSTSAAGTDARCPIWLVRPRSWLGSARQSPAWRSLASGWVGSPTACSRGWTRAASPSSTAPSPSTPGILSAMRCLGVDLAWRETTPAKPANDTGVAALDECEALLGAGWTVGLEETEDRITAHACDDTLLFVDAPLIVDNPTGQRSCDRQVGQCYGRWQVSANTINLDSPYLAGARLPENLEVGAGHLMWAPSS